MALSAVESFVILGMPYPQASLVAAQIAADTGNADALAKIGFPVPTAAELASQITLAASPPTNATGRLVSAGIAPGLASAIVAAIAA